MNDPEVSRRQAEYAARYDRRREVQAFWLWFYFNAPYEGRLR